MGVRDRLAAVVDASVRRPKLTLAIVGAIAIACAVVALGLKPAAGISTYVSSGTRDYQTTQQDYREFGGEAVVVLVREPLRDLVGSRDLGVISELEACLDGGEVAANSTLGAFEPVPAAQAQPYGGRSSPCGQLMAHKPAQIVYGPGTFLNKAVLALNTEISQIYTSARQTVASASAAAEKLATAEHESAAQVKAAGAAAAQLAAEQESTSLGTLALDSGITSAPSIDNTSLIDQIVFDNLRGAYVPKARLNYLFPTSGSALIQVRLRPNLTSVQTGQAINWIREATQMPAFRLGYGGSYLVSGQPVVLQDLAGEVTGQIAILLIAACVVMAIVLLCVFRGILRLLPLGLALAAAAITFGLTALAGATLTMASIAVLPILIGLAVDYAIQFQSRAHEPGGAGDAALTGAAGAARTGAPTIAAAAIATATGFLVLLTSPVPMVRGFGLLLVVGVIIAFACTITAGAAAIAIAGRRGLRNAGTPGIPGRVGSAGSGTRPGALGDAFRGAREILAELAAALRGAAAILRPGADRLGSAWARSSGWFRRLFPAQIRRAAGDGRPKLAPLLTRLAANPGRVLTAGAALALIGWALDTQTSVQSDITKLVPKNMTALRNLTTLERTTGVSGEIDVLVHANDVATPATVGWMIRYENEIVRHFGYLETKGCFAATLCPALSLPDLFEADGTSAATNSSSTSSSSLTQASINGLLASVPPYFSQAVLSSDHHYAVLAFGARLMPLARQQQVIDYLRDHLDPPKGVTAGLAGFPVLASDANAALSSAGRRLLTLVLGILAVGLVLFAVFRSRRRVLVPLTPIVLATGWSALLTWLVRIPLNPMSATLGALVIAISTEFSVLLSERYGQERDAGLVPAAALERAYRSTGRAVLASGITAIAGFGVLVASDFTMLRDFGFVTIIDMSVSLAGVLLVLPAVLVVAEQDRPLRERIRGLGSSRRPARPAIRLPRRRRRERATVTV